MFEKKLFFIDYFKSNTTRIRIILVEILKEKKKGFIKNRRNFFEMHRAIRKEGESGQAGKREEIEDRQFSRHVISPVAHTSGANLIGRFDL